MSAVTLGDFKPSEWYDILEKALKGDTDAIEIITDLNQDDIDFLVDLAAMRRRNLEHALMVNHLAAVDQRQRAGTGAKALHDTLDRSSDVRGLARLQRAFDTMSAAREVADKGRR